MSYANPTSPAPVAQANQRERDKLLPQAARTLLPPIGTTDGHANPMAQVKFFTPDGSWTFYAFEFDGEETFFGLVDGLTRELGYFSFDELLGIRGSLGLPVERDRYFEPTPLSELP